MVYRIYRNRYRFIYSNRRTDHSGSIAGRAAVQARRARGFRFNHFSSTCILGKVPNRLLHTSNDRGQREKYAQKTSPVIVEDEKSHDSNVDRQLSFYGKRKVAQNQTITVSIPFLVPFGLQPESLDDSQKCFRWLPKKKVVRLHSRSNRIMVAYFWQR